MAITIGISCTAGSVQHLELENALAGSAAIGAVANPILFAGGEGGQQYNGDTKGKQGLHS